MLQAQIETRGTVAVCSLVASSTFLRSSQVIRFAAFVSLSLPPLFIMWCKPELTLKTEMFRNHGEASKLRTMYCDVVRLQSVVVH